MSAGSTAHAERQPVALLVALDEEATTKIGAELRPLDFSIASASTLEEAASRVHFGNVAVVVARDEPESAFAALCQSCSDVPVIAVSTSDEGRQAESLRAGATATIAAIDAEEIRSAIARASSARTDRSLEPPAPVSRRTALLGNSQAMRYVGDLVRRTASSLATALLRGETGTGKELVARSLHDQSPRRDGPFVKVHCAALPDSLLESELFGYEKGAFTGAAARKPGRVELAESGTLFLDEIGDITPAVQVKLLRLLQDRGYERLGGVRSIRADVRFVAATHRDLEAMVKRGEFREDLFYRLNVVPIWLPPLRARREDVPLLAEAFAIDFARVYGKPEARLEPAAIAALQSERWPGNVRQLQNFVERLVVLARGPITTNDVRHEMNEHVRFETQLTGLRAVRPKDEEPEAEAVAANAPMQLGEAVRHAERAAIERALLHTNGNRTVAARILGVSRATLYAKLDEHGLG
jgi:two-component system, NtrC family, response regulator AtoC